jgi:hypothetical protein
VRRRRRNYTPTQLRARQVVDRAHEYMKVLASGLSDAMKGIWDVDDFERVSEIFNGPFRTAVLDERNASKRFDDLLKRRTGLPARPNGRAPQKKKKAPRVK